MRSKLPASSKQASDITLASAKFIAKDMRPISIVEGELCHSYGATAIASIVEGEGFLSFATAMEPPISSAIEEDDRQGPTGFTEGGSSKDSG